MLQDFWKKYSAQIRDEDLPDLENILLMEDLDLLGILLGQRPVPKGYRQDLFKMLLMK